MSTVVFDVNVVPYGACVQQVDIWRDTLNGIGRWEVILDPAGNCAFPNHHVLAVDAGVRIRIDGGAGMTTMMWGTIDDILPYLDRKGYHTELIKITGRDRAIDLAQHQVTGKWSGVAATAVIGNGVNGLVDLTPSDLTMVPLGAPPVVIIDYEADRTYLGDAIREVCDLAGYDFYVDNTAVGAGNANLNVFSPGGSAAPVTLIDFPDSATNNILHVDPVGEQIGKDIKNYIDGHCGSLSDHWTEFNAENLAAVPPVYGWVAVNPIRSAVTNDTVLFLNPAAGGSSIRITNTGAPWQPILELDFSAAAAGALPWTTKGDYYGYTGTNIDLSEPCVGSYNYYVDDTVNAVPRVRMRLRDAAGNEIEWVRSTWAAMLGAGWATQGRNCTDYPVAAGPSWRKVDFQLGYDCGIEAPAIGPDAGGHWNAIIGGGVFNWNTVERIRFSPFGVGALLADGDFFCVDGLCFPNLEVRSRPITVASAASQAAIGWRMKDYYQPNIKSQVELNAFILRKLLELTDAKETLTCTAIGQTGTPFAGQTLDVVAPTLGIGGPAIGNTIVYRIIKVHHKVVKNSEASERPGWTYTTDYELVRYQYYGGVVTQYVESTKVISTTSPTESMLRETRLAEQARRTPGSVKLLT